MSLPTNGNVVQAIGKAALSVNGASIVRTLRFGVGAGMQALVDSYQAVDPFSEGERNRARLEKLPVRALRDLAQVPGSLVLDLRWAEMSGATPLNDMVSILTLAVLQQPEAVLEFGTFWGSTTVNLAMNLPSAVIHTIDLPPDRSEAEAAIKNRPVDDKNLIRSRELGRAFCGTEFESSIVQHTGDTATYNYSAIRENVSFFLIDGSHTYEYAKSDTLNALEMARGPVTFTWHDCDGIHPGVTGWLGELAAAGLPVVRIEGTIVACLRVDASDPKVREMFAAAASGVTQ